VTSDVRPSSELTTSCKFEEDPQNRVPSSETSDGVCAGSVLYAHYLHHSKDDNRVSTSTTAR